MTTVEIYGGKLMVIDDQDRRIDRHRALFVTWMSTGDTYTMRAGGWGKHQTQRLVNPNKGAPISQPVASFPDNEASRLVEATFALLDRSNFGG